MSKIEAITNREAITKLHILREMLLDMDVEIESFGFVPIVSAILFLESDIPIESWIVSQIDKQKLCQK